MIPKEFFSKHIFQWILLSLGSWTNHCTFPPCGKRGVLTTALNRFLAGQTVWCSWSPRPPSFGFLQLHYVQLRPFLTLSQPATCAVVTCGRGCISQTRGGLCGNRQMIYKWCDTLNNSLGWCMSLAMLPLTLPSQSGLVLSCTIVCGSFVGRLVMCGRTRAPEAFGWSPLVSSLNLPLRPRVSHFISGHLTFFLLKQDKLDHWSKQPLPVHCSMVLGTLWINWSDLGFRNGTFRKPSPILVLETTVYSYGAWVILATRTQIPTSRMLRDWYGTWQY